MIYMFIVNIALDNVILLIIWENIFTVYYFGFVHYLSIIFETDRWTDKH